MGHRDTDAVHSSLESSTTASVESFGGDEQTPLLRKPLADEDSSSNAAQGSSSWLSHIHIPNPFKADVIDPKYRWVPLITALILFLNEVDFYIKDVPLMRMVESMYCFEYYQAHDPTVVDQYGFEIPERLCKIRAIESNVSRMVGLILFFVMVAALLGNIPLSRLADRYGRKWILVMNKLVWLFFTSWQLIVYFAYPRLPVWTMYFSGAFALFGGNFDFGLAIFFASITDIVKSDSQRTTLFFALSAMLPAAQLVSPALGGWLLEVGGPWVPHVVALVSIFISVLLSIFAYPETMQPKDKAKLADMEEPPPPAKAQDLAESSLSSSRIYLRAAGGLKAFFSQRYARLENAVAGIGVFSYALFFLSTLCFTIGIKSIDWYGLIQYAMIKLQWKYSQTTLPVSLQAAIVLINYGFIIPFVTELLARRLGTTANASIALMIGSAVLLVVGICIVGISASTWLYISGVIIYTLGEGLPTALQAYVASLIDSTMAVTVLGGLALAQTGGKMIGSLVFPMVLAAGLKLPNGALQTGLPEFSAAGLFLISGACILVHSLRRSRGSDMVEHV